MKDPYKRLPQEIRKQTRLAHVQQDLARKGISYELDMVAGGKWTITTTGAVTNQRWTFSADHVLLSSENV